MARVSLTSWGFWKPLAARGTRRPNSILYVEGEAGGVEVNHRRGVYVFGARDFCRGRQRGQARSPDGSRKLSEG